MRLVPEEPRPRAAFSLSYAEQGQDIRSPQTKASAGTGKPEAGLPPADPDETREMPLKRETPLRPLAAIRLTEKRNGTGTPLLDQMASPPHAVSHEIEQTQHEDVTRQTADHVAVAGIESQPVIQAQLGG